MFPKTYFLGQNYYDDVAQATDLLISYGDKYSDIISNYSYFIKSHELEELRTQEEYLIELLIIGTLWTNYSKNAVKLTKTKGNLLNHLYHLRKNNKILKPYVDKIRGVLHTSFLLKESIDPVAVSENSFSQLIEWLSASGDFNEEVERFKIWQEYFHKISGIELNFIIYSAVEFQHQLEKICSNYLKSYIGNTNIFLNTQKENYKNKEDIIFTGKKPNEYYLNMVCAEILNRVYREKFIQTEKKIVLVPTCMSLKENCKAIKSEKSYKCTECNSSCNIYKIVQLGKNHNFEVALIPHSSNFSKWLEAWKDQKHTGLIGVACLLNLLTGGYEMRRLNIPSQCVLLNFSGCIKHWGLQKSTGIFTSQLLKMLDQN